ncbi:globin-coupled sensor protein [Paenibacillus eucommiae]|uniref:Heme-based aerotactic transducer n=1 Tax=Paenibacillus eucommiae TaxID=1355755 RepID=A0ABS4IWN3_9BACL|nr:globin-coupled sensor protein [Paenibacillus eucommiae]MBP1992002.1 heme-based aerotactic transducer [Paenibacillus eucommiae]
MIQVTEARKAMLDYIGLTDEDLQILKNKEAEFKQIVTALVDELYDDITKWPELNAIINSHSTLDRLKQTQHWYFLSMTSGVIDNEFIEKRLAIGRVHSKIGLSTNWYLGTYLKYSDLAAIHFKKILPHQWVQVTHSLSKMFSLDSQLVLEAYEQDEQAKIQQLADDQQEILTTVSKAVQDLAAMIVELTSSSQAVAETAISTAESQDQSHSRLQDLNKEIEDISDMETTMRDISEQTHLLGLNAAIEAARSGEHGRGFQVVANEIRKLAARSKNSLDLIHDKLESVSQALEIVETNSRQTSIYARTQAASAQELTSFVQMIDRVAEELDELRKE